MLRVLFVLQDLFLLLRELQLYPDGNALKNEWEHREWA